MTKSRKNGVSKILWFTGIIILWHSSSHSLRSRMKALVLNQLLQASVVTANYSEATVKRMGNRHCSRMLWSQNNLWSHAEANWDGNVKTTVPVEQDRCPPEQHVVPSVPCLPLEVVCNLACSPQNRKISPQEVWILWHFLLLVCSSQRDCRSSVLSVSAKWVPALID